MSSELNWRRGYHDHIDREIRQLKAWRDDPDSCPPTEKRQELPGLYRTRAVFDLTDSQIESIARRNAEVTIHRVIHIHGHERKQD